MPEETAVPTEILAEAIAARDGSAFLKLAEVMHYADLATVYENLGEDEEREFFMQTLSPERLSDVLADVPDSMVPEALENLRPSQQKKILEAADDDDRVDILQDLSEGKQEELLALLPESEEERTRNLLEYDEETAGGRMTTRVAKLTAEMTVREAIDTLRGQLEDTETLTRIFIVDLPGL